MKKSELIYKYELLEEKLEKSNEDKNYYKKILMSVEDGVISLDKDGIITFMNPLVEKITGVSSEVGIGKALYDLLSYKFEYSKETIEKIHSKLLEGSLEYSEPSNLELIDEDKNKTIISFKAKVTKNKLDEVDGLVIIFRDVTEELNKIKQIEYLSYHDSLTGLYNRHYLTKALEKYDKPKYYPLCIMVVDVNGLKLTNDAFGHLAGDLLIKISAEAILEVCRENDIVARVGGDEFAVIMPKTNLDEAQKLKDKMIRASSKKKVKNLVVSLAIGYSVKENDFEKVSDVFKEADNQMYRSKAKSGKLMRSKTIETVIRSVNNKYDKEQLHTERVSIYCGQIAEKLGLSEKEIQDIKQAGVLHDIGKTIIPTEILNKPGKLTDEEFALVKKHPIIGYQILKSVDEYALLAEAVLTHHERIDGNGYPRGLKDEEIPLVAKIIAVADAYEAMTVDRPYQKARTNSEALQELKNNIGTQFDEKIVNIFVKIMED